MTIGCLVRTEVRKERLTDVVVIAPHGCLRRPHSDKGSVESVGRKNLVIAKTGSNIDLYRSTRALGTKQLPQAPSSTQNWNWRAKKAKPANLADHAFHVDRN